MIAHLKLRPFSSWFTTLTLALCSIACSKSEAAEAGTTTQEVKPAAAREVVTIKLGYQKFGAPFLLKSRSTDLERHLTEQSAKAEWKEFKHGPALLEAIN